MFSKTVKEYGTVFQFALTYISCQENMQNPGSDSEHNIINVHTIPFCKLTNDASHQKYKTSLRISDILHLKSTYSKLLVGR